jgi:hypothetical protein
VTATVTNVYDQCVGDEGDEIRSVTMSVRLPGEFADWVRKTAKDEYRPHAQFIWVLLNEARGHREAAARGDSP